MKKILTILYSFAILFVGSCVKDGGGLDGNIDGSVVSFNVGDNIAARAVETKDSFVGGEGIGIFMESVIDKTLLSTNVEYKVTTDSGLVYSSGGKIYYPSSGEVRFYAYSPFNSDVKSNVIDIDIINDSDELLVSDILTGSNSTASTAVEFTFGHTLTKINIEYISSLEIPELSNVYVVGSTRASYSLASATLAFTADSKAEISASLSKNTLSDATTSQDIEALILPTNEGGSVDIYFEYYKEDVKYSKMTTIDTSAFESGYIYSYRLTISDLVTLTAGNIEKWSSDSTISANIKATDGTKEYPWAIYTEQDLNNIGATDHPFELDDYYIVMNDIELKSEWTPIGDSTDKFTGSFDGDYYTISELTVSSTSSQYQGLFGYTDGAIIKNISVTGSIKSSGNYVGGIVGRDYSSDDATTITNCSSSVEIEGGSYVGGIIGSTHNTKIDRCYNTGKVTATYDKVGGIAGYNSTSIINCYNSAEVSGSGNDVGGVVGYNISGASLQNSYNIGNVTNKGSGYLGGLIGANYGTVYNCYNAGGLVVITDAVAGGLIGYNDSSAYIATCYYCNTAALSIGENESTSSTATLVSMSSNNMMTESFRTLLSSNKNTITGAVDWTYQEGSYVTLKLNE
ncbi:MAG: fimbrillin family protein [Rikenellaceae bacterium]